MITGWHLLVGFPPDFAWSRSPADGGAGPGL